MDRTDKVKYAMAPLNDMFCVSLEELLERARLSYSFAKNAVGPGDAVSDALAEFIDATEKLIEATKDATDSDDDDDIQPSESEDEADSDVDVKRARLG